jgi:hypothetical protein
VDHIPAAVNVRAHFGIPAARAMAEMDSCFDKLFRSYSSQTISSKGGTPAKSELGTMSSER